MAEETKIGMKLEEEAKPIKKMCEKLMDAVNYELDKGVENIDTKELGEAIDMIKDLYEAKKEMYEACYYKQIMEAMEESEYGEDYDEEGPMNERMYYRGQPRDSRGRYMSRRGRGGRRGFEEPMMAMDLEEYKEYMRDMDMPNKMYYSGGSSSGGSSSGSSGMSGGSSMGSSGGSMGGSSSGGGSRGYSENSQSGRGQQGRDSREGRSGMSRRSYMETKEMHKGNTPEDKQAKVKELDAYMKELSEDVTEMITDASQEEKNVLKSKMQALLQKI